MMRLRRFPFVAMLVLAVFYGSSGCIGVSMAAEAPPPEDGAVFEGQSLILKAEIEGGVPPFRFLWFKNYVPIDGAGEPELRFESIRSSDAGVYWVTVFNDGGSTTSPMETIAVRVAGASRMANVSVAGSLQDRFIVGFTLGGSGTSGSTQILARAAGPALTQFGVTGTLPDPVLAVFQQRRLISMNDDWGGDALLTAAANAVGAFPFPTASKDSAVVLSLGHSTYSAEVVDGAGGTGVTVVELYDTNHDRNSVTPRLVSVSARGTTGPDGSLTAGFTIQGETNVTVLLRGLGPALERFGVTGVLENPRLTLFRGSTHVSSNDDWSEFAPAAIESAQAAVGAFALDAGVPDAALVIPLSPGSYTAQVYSTTESGVAMIEVYEVP